MIAGGGGLLLLLFQNCGILATDDPAAALPPLSSISYTHLGVLSAPACGDANRRVLHLEPSVNPVELYHAVLDGVEVSSCAAYDFAATNPSAVVLEYRSLSSAVSACSDGCTDGYCGTGGVPAVFLSVDPSATTGNGWRRLSRFSTESLARRNGLERVVVPLGGAGTVRSVLVCRDGSGHERDDIEVRSVSLVPGATGDPQPSTATKPPVRTLLETAWQTRHLHLNAQPNRVWEGVPYPASEVYDLLSGWMVTQNEEWKADIERQLAYAHTRLTPDGFPDDTTTYTFLSRDTMAREATAFYDAGLVLRNPQYRRWADEIAVRMMTSLARTDFTWKGRTYKLFHVTYDRQPPHAPLDSATSIDPNQNAELGALYTMLYFDPSSVLYRNALAKEIATNELEAAMALQTPTGELALNSGSPYIDQYDTNYGSYATSLWVRANTYWKSPTYAQHIALAGQWFSRHMERGSEGEHFWPAHTDTVSTWEMWFRVPALLAAGVDTGDYVRMIKNSWLSPGFPFYFRMVGLRNDVFLSE